MINLAGKIAVVTGASRGIGRGIALALGEAGATVYVTGRSTRGGETTEGRAETIEQTAEMVGARGGEGIAVRCDHTVDAEVEALFTRVKEDIGRLDILVNNAWGGYEIMVDVKPFWEILAEHWDLMFGAGLRAQVMATRHALPLMPDRAGALVVNTTAPIGPKYHGQLFYDVAKTASMRMTKGMGEDLKDRAIAVVALAPGWTRTERVLDAFGVDSDGWGEIPVLANSESPVYIGRAVAALAGDEKLLERSGGCFEVGQLARDYDFSDVDGRKVAPFSEQYPEAYYEP